MTGELGMRTRLTWLLAIVLLAGCSGGNDSGEAEVSEARELIFNTYLPPQDSMRRMAVDDFASRIETESGGSLQVTIPGSTLAPPDDQWSIVFDQVADLAMVGNFSQRGLIVLPLIADLPFNVDTSRAASVALWDTYKNYFEAIGEFQGVRPLAMYTLPGFGIISREREVRSMGDLAGMKLWASAGATSEAASAVGVVPVYSPFPQLFEYVSKGNVDGALIGAGTIRSASLAGHVSNMTAVPGGLGSTSFSVIMNQATWDSLTEEQQAAVTRAAAGLPERIGAVLDQRNDDVLRETGLTIIEAGAEFTQELRDRMEPMKAQWIAAAEGKGLANAEAALAYYRQRMAEVASGSTAGE